MNQQSLISQPFTCQISQAVDGECVAAYSRELDYICRTLRRVGVPGNDVEDMAHEVFLVLNRTWHKYDSSRPLRAYLFGIAFRVASSNRRRTWRETTVADVDARACTPDPDRELQTKRARALVLAALARIPLPRRAVLTLHDLDEIPMREIARELSIPLFTAYSRLRKARCEFEKAVIRLDRECSNP